jgi:3-oxoacyl-[acyl-carrier protein] reductase
MLDLAGKRILVTGGNRGIGAACARLLVRAGAAVWVHYRSRRAVAEELVAELAGLSPEPHRAAAADLADADQVAGLLGQVEDRWGRLDGLVHNAGLWVENPLASFSLEAYEETLAVNLRGAFLGTRAALPLLARGSEPAIVNIASTAGQRGEPRYSPYAASKGALISATKAWAVELAPAIRVNAVAPGWVLTDMTTGALAGEAGEKARREIPLQRIATPEDVAGPVAFLLSSLARHVTGEILNVNGGSVLVG